MYKALAEISVDRVDFLSHQFARPRPVGVGTGSTVQALFDAFKSVSASEELAQANLRAIFNRLERVHRFPLSRRDEDSIKAMYESFYVAGPDIRWDPDGGSWIPSYAELMVQTDPQGHQQSYLASEENFRILKEYEAGNRIVPLVGDFGGDKAVRAVGRYLKDHDATVATFYISNVEGYLRGDSRARFVRNVSTLPLQEHSTFIRTIFTSTNHTEIRPDYETSTVTEPILQWVNSFKR